MSEANGEKIQIPPAVIAFDLAGNYTEVEATVKGPVAQAYFQFLSEHPVKKGGEVYVTHNGGERDSDLITIVKMW